MAPNRIAKTESPAAVLRPGICVEACELPSTFADVDGAQAIAERGGHAAHHIAIVAAADIADAEAVAEVVMMEAAAPATTPSAAPRMRGSGGGSQRDGAERSCGNECEGEFAEHGRSPSMCAVARVKLSS